MKFFKKKKEPVVLVCGGEDVPVRTSGSILTVADCGHKVWIALTGQKAMSENPDIVTTCLMCALPAMMKSDNRRESVPGALENLDRELGEAHRAAAERVMLALGIKPNG